MLLSKLISNLEMMSIVGPTDRSVRDLCYHSGRAQEGDVFVALRGVEADGHQYIDSALERGVAAVLAQEPPRRDLDATWIQVANTRQALAEMARVFHGDPSAQLALAGVTGTNGKTTTAFLLQHLAIQSWERFGLLGTVHYDLGSGVEEAARTTPESLDLQSLLAQVRDAGCRGAVMEVSSHGLAQGRTDGVQFDVGIFTNLSRDHLDYHGTMERYFAAKRKLFEQMAQPGGKGRPTMVVNADDAYGKRLIAEFAGQLPVLSYGMGMKADFRAQDVRQSWKGTRYELVAKGRQFLVRLPLIGRFNVYNSLAALAGASALGLNLRESVRALEHSPQVPGRLENVAARHAFPVYVDYAHTHDALASTLRTLRELEPSRIITVFGCGGNRDREKRAMMGAAADYLSDYTILTSDNPRRENPQAILSDIEKGFLSSKYEVIEDRREAIAQALAMARSGDVVLIAGKGHEKVQEFADHSEPFDDRVVARQCLRDLSRE